MPHDHHHGPLFSEVSSCLEKELLGQSIIIADDAATAEARATATADMTVENLLTLAAKLSFQQRHRESAGVCEIILALDPHCYAAHRRLGLNLMKTLRHKQAFREFLWCLERSEDLPDLHYRLGLSMFYDGQFEQAWYWFLSCFKLSEDNGEMYIAVLYWTILALKKQGRTDWQDFVKEVDAGHHVGYRLFVQYVTGEISREELDAAIQTIDTLSKTCVDYAMYVWLEQDEPAEAERYMQHMLTCCELWGSFSFLGGYTEYLRRQKYQTEGQEL